MEVNQNFTGIWLSREIFLNKELSWFKMILLSEIRALSHEKGYCFASNSWFAEFFGLTDRHISRTINELANDGYITTQLIYGPDKQVKARIIKIVFEKVFVESTPIQVENEFDETDHTPRQECLYPPKRMSVPPEKNVCTPRKECLGYNKEYNKELEKETTISKDIVEKKPTSGFSQTDKQKSLISTKTKTSVKEKKMSAYSTMLKMIECFSENDEVVNKLKTYLAIRFKKGLIVEQWEIILAKLKSYSSNAEEQLIELNNAIAGGYMNIVPDWKMNKDKPKFDNTSNHRKQKSWKEMTEEERYEATAKDENGNILVF